METEEQLHIQYLKERAESIGLTFEQYMLFLIFETLEHAAVLNNQQAFMTPWEEQYQNEMRGEGKENSPETFEQPDVGGL